MPDLDRGLAGVSPKMPEQECGAFGASVRFLDAATQQRCRVGIGCTALAGLRRSASGLSLDRSRHGHSMSRGGEAGFVGQSESSVFIKKMRPRSPRFLAHTHTASTTPHCHLRE